MGAVALIPARAGSQRLPGKHLLPLGGHPLIAWTLEAAVAADIFDAIWVSSDSPDVLDLAADTPGVRPHRRPADLAGDGVTLAHVIAAAVGWFHLDDLDSLYVLLPTSPFRAPGSCRRAWETFREEGGAALLSVTPCEHPPQWTLTRNAYGQVTPFSSAFGMPRHKLKRLWRHDGGHYIVRAPAARLGHPPATFGWPVAFPETVDINTGPDLAWAQFLLDQGAVPWLRRDSSAIR